MPQPTVKNIGTVAEKWARRSASAGQEYEMGVTGAGARWAAAAGAADKVYQQAVTAAAGAGRFGKGVQKAGPQKYEKRAREVGPARFSQGVAVAQGEYQSQVAPYLQAIAATDLPPRGPVGSDGNYARVAAIGRALRTLKMGR